MKPNLYDWASAFSYSDKYLTSFFNFSYNDILQPTSIQMTFIIKQYVATTMIKPQHFIGMNAREKIKLKGY